MVNYAFSGAALFVSLCALTVSIRLPLYLAKRAEKRARLEQDREKLPPFYRKVKEFAEGFNTPGVGYRIQDVYYLSNDASELGLKHFQTRLMDLCNDMEKYHTTPHDQQGKRNGEGEYEVSPDHAALGKQIQSKLSSIYQMAKADNDRLFGN